LAQQILFGARSINGSLVASVPLLGQEIFAITRAGHAVNLGQVVSASYEEGGGRGFNIRTTRMEGQAYVKLQHPELATPLRWS